MSDFIYGVHLMFIIIGCCGIQMLLDKPFLGFYLYVIIFPFYFILDKIAENINKEKKI